jgi:hypothetical protein
VNPKEQKDEVFSQEDFMMIDNKDAITHKYSEFTQEVAQQI